MIKKLSLLVFKTEDRQPERTLIRHSVQMLAEKYGLVIWLDGEAIMFDFIDAVLKSSDVFELAEWNARHLLEPKFARIEAGTVIYITTCGGSELHQTYVGKKSEQWRKK
ncbi:hypothetical protein [Brucella thiophenivorans]|uniref:Uncharacterized protein n=1 Tax=Brucella thiophenivorans TaxID=571255 RepID=A0A256FTR0_9HYPH|nr:hypothetical protein [Brucella thiophenivorans]OYR18265.1 hypothetical protein CEV31_4277 [Brucella thiophenivorans]